MTDKQAIPMLTGPVTSTLPDMIKTTPSDTNVSVQIYPNLLKNQQNDLVGAIDQGTSSTRFLVFTRSGQIGASAQMEHKQIFPDGEDKVGWHEHNPIEIWENTKTCIKAVANILESKAGINLLMNPLKAIGITNQRETTIAWNAKTGLPYHNAIVWDDVRTTHIAARLGHIDALREKTGLPLASYFAGTKVKWLLDNVEQLRHDLETSPAEVKFGTVDSWLAYQLSGVESETKGAANVGGIHVTDVSNSSRWLFLDLHSLQWDQELVNIVCAPHSLPVTCLPDICPSSYLYAVCKASCGIPVIDRTPIASILGDQQAALFGQTAFEPGEAKNTYGTGLFLMMNTGTKIVPSTHGLLTTVAYQIGVDGEVHYALEGSVSHSGSTIQWLRDQLNLIESASQSESFASTTTHNDGLYFVPAFAGLFAPHWRSDARACIVGMTATHHKGHICRAALEAAAYQTREVFEAIYADSNVKLKALKVDGGGTANKLLMQFQSDIINVDVVKPAVMETTAIGAAFAAGLAVGVWKDLAELKELWGVAEMYTPAMDNESRKKNWKGWQKAISRSLEWIEDDLTKESNGAEEEVEITPPGSRKEQTTMTEAKPMTPIVAGNRAGVSNRVLLATSVAAMSIGFLFGRKR
jgi:glycerol kinase